MIVFGLQLNSNRSAVVHGGRVDCSSLVADMYGDVLGQSMTVRAELSTFHVDIERVETAGAGTGVHLEVI